MPTFATPPDPDRTTTTGGERKRRHLPGTLRSLALAVLLALVLRFWLIEPRWIPSGSMLPTLQLQDRVLVEKASRRLGRQPRRGDVVVFSPPPSLQASGYGSSRALIKRVVGLPGDRIAVHHGQLRRNGTSLVEPWTVDAMTYEQPEVTVPNHQLWVLGDNRNDSFDSHVWGPLPEQNLLGRAVFRYWPLQRLGWLGGGTAKEQ